MHLTPAQFRARYQNMLDMKKQRFIIKLDSDDPWGIVITSRALTHVQVWHNLPKATLTLGLSGEGRRYVGDAVPPGAEPEDTGKFRMFRWRVPVIDGSVPPHLQPGMAEVIDQIRAAFDWVRQNRVRLT